MEQLTAARAVLPLGPPISVPVLPGPLVSRQVVKAQTKQSAGPIPPQPNLPPPPVQNRFLTPNAPTTQNTSIAQSKLSTLGQMIQFFPQPPTTTSMVFPTLSLTNYSPGLTPLQRRMYTCSTIIFENHGINRFEKFGVREGICMRAVKGMNGDLQGSIARITLFPTAFFCGSFSFWVVGSIHIGNVSVFGMGLFCWTGHLTAALHLIIFA
jgi:hypothetical protein